MIPSYLKIGSLSPFIRKQQNKRKTKMSEVLDKIRSLDQHLSRTVASYRSRNDRPPTELDLMKDAATVPLITQRKRLVKQYKYLKQEANYASRTYKTIKDDPIMKAQRSFSGIRPMNPFDENRTYNKTPIKRIGYNTNKGSVLWDPRFNFGDTAIDPKTSRYYHKLTRGF